MRDVAPIGVIGGSGFYDFLSNPTTRAVSTPYGDPSAPIEMGDVDGQPVAFLARHGIGHVYPPHKVNYRANIWALRSLGVERILSPCAAGSLSSSVHPGDFVVLDQVVDRTWGRADTFFDGPDVQHTAFADPYCAATSAHLASAVRDAGVTLHERGTVVVINGPRFSSRAESSWFRAQGWEVVNMTQYPETVLARELGMCFAGLALVTDYDSGVVGDEAATTVVMHDVFEVMRNNVDRLRGVLAGAIGSLAASPRGGCDCGDLRAV